MLLREQAIEIINTHVDENDFITFKYSFPYHLIPNDLNEELFIESEIFVRVYSFTKLIQYTVEKYFPKIDINKMTEEEFKFKAEKINYHFLINKLNDLQKKFDSLYDTEKGIEVITILNTIRELDYLLIDKAEILKNLNEEIEKNLLEFNEEIQDRNNW